MLRSIRPEVGLGIRHYDSEVSVAGWLMTLNGTAIGSGYLH